MFDDEMNAGQNQEPSIDDIPDIFDGGTMADASPETSVTGPSALDAGKFQRLPDSASTDAMPSMQADLHEPSMAGKILIALGILVVVLGGGGAVWYVKNNASGISNILPLKNSETETTPEVIQEQQQPQPETPPELPEAIPTPSETTPTSTVTPTIPVDMGGNVDVNAPALDPTQGKIPTPITPPTLPGPTVPTPSGTTTDSQLDTDKDGLTDVREAQLGTDKTNADTDKDGLTDGSEVTIWKTNPLLSDTDGDTYPDGQEVLNNFNPNGPGKLR